MQGTTSHMKTTVIGSNMDGPRDHNVRWDKPVVERQIHCDFSYMKNLKSLSSQKQNSNYQRWGMAREWKDAEQVQKQPDRRAKILVFQGSDYNQHYCVTY